MKKLLLFVFMAGSIFQACKKAEELRYDSRDNIYINLNGIDDSLIYTFANFPGKGRDTVYLPVRIAGIRKDYDRKFILRVEQDSSTAKENLHFEPLEPFYIMDSGVGQVNVPIILYNKDAMLQEKSVSLRFKLEANEDFGINIPKYTKAKLVFSSKLENPGRWWSMWFGGYYSQTKHQFFIIVTGLTSLSTEGLDAPKNQYLAGLVQAFLRDPFTWVQKNPQKGYKIEEKASDNPNAPKEYEFFSVDNPSRRVLYKKSANDGLYYFIDETYQEVH